MVALAGGLAIGGLMALIFGVVYRLNRKLTQRAPSTPEEIEDMRLKIDLLPRHRRGPALEQLRIRQDWRYSLKRERVFLAVAAALFLAAVIVLVM
jgi:hypothetical protein